MAFSYKLCLNTWGPHPQITVSTILGKRGDLSKDLSHHPPTYVGFVKIH